MQQEIRLATFNVLNLALPGMRMYDNLATYSVAEYDAKISWLAQQMDALDADVIGFQEIFSQDALRDVLARTQLYKNAHHVGFDPDPRDEKLTPSVALVSRLPLVPQAQAIRNYPHDLCVAVPGDSPAEGGGHFTRPVLQAQVRVSDTVVLNVFVVHLKSKRPDFLAGESENDPYQLGLANLRSLIRRGTEALGLRYLLSDYAKKDGLPLVVMGDFNDVADAVTTQMVMGGGRYENDVQDGRMFDCYRIAAQRDALRDVSFTSVHEDRYETIDHILVSEEFNRTSRAAIGEVLEVIYLNDHIARQLPEASDHGQLVARIRLFETA